MCNPEGVIEDEVKLRLFNFSFTGRAKDWLLYLPNDIIATWKELEDKYFERFFTTTLFYERRAEISNFEKQDT